MKLTLALSLAASAALSLAGPPALAKGLTVDDMLAMQRVGDPRVSPDGTQVVFTVRDTDLEANRGRVDLYLTKVDGTGARRLTSHPENDTDPRWSRDGAWIYFVSTRSGSAQVWRISPTGGEAEQVTRLPLDVGGFALYPDGRRLVGTPHFIHCIHRHTIGFIHINHSSCRCLYIFSIFVCCNGCVSNITYF